MKFNRDMTMEKIMERWPTTIDVLMDYRMLCIGCPVAGFHTIIDAAREHNVDLEELENCLIDSIGQASGKRQP